MKTWKQKRRVMKRYDRSAHVYDGQYGEEQEAKIRTALDEVHFKKTDVIVDVGCGTGQLLPHVVSMVKLVVCVDVSRNLLSLAKTRAQNSGNVAVMRAEADNLPFQPRKFNAALAITLLQNMPSPIQTLNEMKRVTKYTAAIIVTGLRKSFDEAQFIQLLKKATLRINSLRLDAAQREYVAVCTKVKESLNRTCKAL